MTPKTSLWLSWLYPVHSAPAHEGCQCALPQLLKETWARGLIPELRHTLWAPGAVLNSSSFSKNSPILGSWRQECRAACKNSTPHPKQTCNFFFKEWPVDALNTPVFLCCWSVLTYHRALLNKPLGSAGLTFLWPLCGASDIFAAGLVIFSLNSLSSSKMSPIKHSFSV